MASRNIEITVEDMVDYFRSRRFMEAEEAAALLDAVERGMADMEGMLLDDKPLITEKWLKLARRGRRILRESLKDADPDWMEKTEKWKNQKEPQGPFY